MSNNLTAKVKAVNNTNKYANELYSKLASVFTPLVGQKLMKVDGTLLEKYKKLLPEFPCTVPLHVYRHVSDYSLAWSVKTCEPVSPNGCIYHETTVYVGDLRDGVLASILNPPNFRSDYTVEEIETKREVLREAKKILSNAQNDIYPFGEYD